jgi:hypothetical protein
MLSEVSSILLASANDRKLSANPRACAAMVTTDMPSDPRAHLHELRNRVWSYRLRLRYLGARVWCVGAGGAASAVTTRGQCGGGHAAGVAARRRLRGAVAMARRRSRVALVTRRGGGRESTARLTRSAVASRRRGGRESQAARWRSRVATVNRRALRVGRRGCCGAAVTA